MYVLIVWLHRITRAAVIGGSIAAAVSIITLIVVIVALICRHKRHRKRVIYQLPDNAISIAGKPGVSYIPMFPVSGGPPNQQPLHTMAQNFMEKDAEPNRQSDMTVVNASRTDGLTGTTAQRRSPASTIKPTSYHNIASDDDDIMYGYQDRDSKKSSYGESEYASANEHPEVEDTGVDAVTTNRIESINSQTTAESNIMVSVLRV